MPRYTAADHIDFWKSLPGTITEKTEEFGSPSEYAREMVASQSAKSDEQVAAEADLARDEYQEHVRMTCAFHKYFATTPAGQEEGRWLNLPWWQWSAAGKPEKIAVGQHPARAAELVKFTAEWTERRATGKPMTMTAPTPPTRPRFGRRAA